MLEEKGIDYCRSIRNRACGKRAYMNLYKCYNGYYVGMDDTLLDNVHNLNEEQFDEQTKLVAMYLDRACKDVDALRESLVIL